MIVDHFCSVSGGADSLATMIDALERAQKRAMNLRFLNCDLGIQESQITHDYIGYLEQNLGITIERHRANFDAEFAHRRDTIQHHWSQEKRRKEHSAECKGRRAAAMDPDDERTAAGMRARRAKMKAWRDACECKVRISPPVPQEIIDRAKALLVPTGEPFLDLCMLKGRFPSRTAQFCTEQLKLEVINRVIHPRLEAGRKIVSWIGEMAEESPKRARKPQIERIRWTGTGQLVLFRPRLHCTKADNFALAKRHGIKPNPLYLMGFGRVGCMLCINCGKDEIEQADKRFPEVIARIREWENIVAQVSRRGDATFFPAPMVPGDENDFRRAQIDNAVEWARTSRGGRQFDIMQAIARAEAEEAGLMCESAYGLCE